LYHKPYSKVASYLAFFVVFPGFSLLGCSLPVAAHWVQKVPEKLLVMGNFFGCGVVIATAFIHMIPVRYSPPFLAK
jgi:hypothetical protein